MERAAAPAFASDNVTFRDGIGERRTALDPNGQSTEMLSIRGELSAVPSFEFALRERVGRLVTFRHAYYSQIKSVERLTGPESTLGLLSDRVEGIRLSELFARTAARGLNLDINAAICLIRQLAPAVAKLHELSPDIAHAALGPERIVVTPNARLVITEYALGAALEQLRYSQERYWKDLRIALPRSAGLPHFDQRADVTQLGVVALSLILGRLLRDDEYPSRIGDVVASAWAVSPKGGFEPLPPGIRGWLGRSLQLDARNSFANAIEANTDLERVLGDSEYIGLPASLESFMARYQAAEALELFATEADPIPPPSSVPNAAPAPVSAVTSAPASAPALTATAPTLAPPARVQVSTGPTSDINSFLSELVESTPAPAEGDMQTLAASVASKPKAVALPPKAAKPAPVEARRDAPVVVLPIASAAASAVLLPDMFGEHQPKSHGWSRTALAVGAAAIALILVGLPLGRSWVRPTPAPATGTLTITTNPSGATAVIDGKPSGTTPVTLTLLTGSHTVELRGVGEPRSVPVTITAGAQMSQYIELPKVSPIVGQLNVRTEPAGATVTVDGVRRGVTPMIVADLTPGDHAVSLDGEAGSVKQNVTIESGAVAALVVPMVTAAGVQASGWLAVTAPIELQIWQSERVLGTSLSDRIMLPVGKHDVELVNDALGFHASRTVQVTAGKLSSLKVDVPNGTIALNALPWADVWLDGERIGETPIGNLAVPIGVHDLVLRHPELGEQHHQLTVSLKGVTRLSVDLRKK